MWPIHCQRYTYKLGGKEDLIQNENYEHVIFVKVEVILIIEMSIAQSTT